MKTTLNLNGQLVVDARALAAQQHTNLSRLVEQGLQILLSSSVVESWKAPAPLPIFHGHGGLVAGIDPRSNKAMLDA